MDEPTQCSEERWLSGETFDHKALFYDGESSFLEGTLAFIRDGLEAGEPTLVMVDEPKTSALQDELGPDSAAVQFANLHDVAANPAWIIPAWRKFVNRHGGSGNLRGIGEPVSAARSPAELAECQIHESLLNLAFADAGQFALLCLYDSQLLDTQVLHDARYCHPHLTDGVSDQRSDDFRCDDAWWRFAAPLPDPPDSAETLEFSAHRLRALRAFVTWNGSAAGLRGHRLEDLVLAADEIATNSIRYGNGRGTMRLWVSGDTVICEARDRGHLDSLLVGRELPPPDQVEGRGLWLANQLCDLVQIRTSAEGTTVRLHVRRDGA
jgi:anti-sigma regulatory factor (Ser/Thr protein kinase)